MESSAARGGERREEPRDVRAGGVLKVSLCMLLVQVFQTGMAVMSKLALNQGMFVFPFLVYRNAIGAICVSCLALVRERNKLRDLSLGAFFWIFMSAFLGLTTAMSLYYYGLRDTSAAYSSIFLNLIPVITFILSAILRIEMLRLGNTSGVVKVLGTLICVGGAMVISLYKGKVLHIWPFHIDISHEVAGTNAIAHNLARGSSFLAGSCISYAFWFILQVKVFKAFPSVYWSTALTCALGCLQSIVLGLVFNRGKMAWQVRTKLQLVAIVYSAILNTAATFVLVAWAVSKRGPIFPSIFTPLSLIFVTIVESLVMGLQITVGSLLGMFLIILGIYAFLWAKTKEIAEGNNTPAPRDSVDDGSGDTAGMASGSAQARSSVDIPDPVQASALRKVLKLPV